MKRTATSEPIGWVRFWKPTDDWYYLDTETRQAYLEAFESVKSRVLEQGAQLLGAYRCRGQSPWARFEVWEFPNLETLIEMTHALETIGHFQYFAEDHTVGRRYEFQGDYQSWML